jgi:hypothetical protein
MIIKIMMKFIGDGFSFMVSNYTFAVNQKQYQNENDTHFNRCNL